ncbi:nitroreductase family protein [Clostridium sp. DL1XJH146]
MQFYDVINKRISVKKFKNTKVEDEKLDRMIKAAMAAPTWKNKSAFKFILVDEKNVKDQISNCVINKTNEAANSIREAPLIAVIASDKEESGEVDGKAMYLVDSAIAMEHFILAAENEGYGTCWIADLDEKSIKSILNIPQKYKVVAMTPVGEALEEKEHYPMKNIGEYFFKNEFHKPYYLN